MKRLLAYFLALLLLLTGCAFAEENDDYEEGGDPPNSPEFYLPIEENSACVWTYIVDNPNVLYITDNGPADLNREGGKKYGPLYSFRLDGQAEGEAGVIFSYGEPNQEPLSQIEIDVTVDDDWNVTIFNTIIQ